VVLSGEGRGHTALVIAESGIDALSYAALHPDVAARYASTGAALNPSQPALLRAAIEKMGQGTRIIITIAIDAGRRALPDQIEAMAREMGQEELRLVRDLPARDGQDWNDVLRAASAAAAGLRPRSLSAAAPSALP
jgi:hypothetical protein